MILFCTNSCYSDNHSSSINSNFNIEQDRVVHDLRNVSANDCWQYSFVMSVFDKVLGVTNLWKH